MPHELFIRRLGPEAKLPTRAHPDDAGLDLYSLEGKTLEPGCGGVISTGVAAAVPRGYVGLIADRSSMARQGIKTAGGVIDAGYRGEIGVVVWNLSRETVSLPKGDRIAQLLIVPIATPRVTETDELDATWRGEKGFGSSGR